MLWMQKMSLKTNQWKWLAVPRLFLGTELACSFVRSTALERMPFSKNRTVGGIAAPTDSLLRGFGTGQLIRFSAPGAQDYSQLFSRLKGPGEAGLTPHVRRSSSHTTREEQAASTASKPWLPSRKDEGGLATWPASTFQNPAIPLFYFICTYFFSFFFFFFFTSIKSW